MQYSRSSKRSSGRWDRNLFSFSIMSVDLLFVLSKTFYAISVFDKELKSWRLNLPMLPLNTLPIILVTAGFSLDAETGMAIFFPPNTSSTPLGELTDSTVYFWHQKGVLILVSFAQRPPIFLMKEDDFRSFVKTLFKMLFKSWNLSSSIFFICLLLNIVGCFFVFFVPAVRSLDALVSNPPQEQIIHTRLLCPIAVNHLPS